MTLHLTNPQRPAKTPPAFMSGDAPSSVGSPTKGRS